MGLPQMISREKVSLSVSPFSCQLIPGSRSMPRSHLSPSQLFPVLGSNIGAFPSTHREALGWLLAVQDGQLCNLEIRVRIPALLGAWYRAWGVS